MEGCHISLLAALAKGCREAVFRGRLALRLCGLARSSMLGWVVALSFLSRLACGKAASEDRDDIVWWSLYVLWLYVRSACCFPGQRLVVEARSTIARACHHFEGAWQDVAHDSAQELRIIPAPLYNVGVLELAA